MRFLFGESHRRRCHNHPVGNTSTREDILGNYLDIQKPKPTGRDLVPRYMYSSYDLKVTHYTSHGAVVGKVVICPSGLPLVTWI